jgi:hypothetical protein
VALALPIAQGVGAPLAITAAAVLLQGILVGHHARGLLHWCLVFDGCRLGFEIYSPLVDPVVYLTACWFSLAPKPQGANFGPQLMSLAGAKDTIAR